MPLGPIEGFRRVEGGVHPTGFSVEHRLEAALQVFHGRVDWMRVSRALLGRPPF